MNHRQPLLALLFASCALAACGGDGGTPSDTTDVATEDGSGGSDVSSDADATPDADTTTPPDADGSDDAVPDATDDTTDTEGSADATDDATDDATADETPDAPRPEGLPDALPFEFTRPEVGEPLTDDEIAAFTRTITRFWRDSDYWRWVRMTSHGVDASNPDGHFDYALWWQDTRAIKSGDTVTFQHHGRADNLTLRTCKVLNNAIAGYLMTGDENMRWVVEQYSRGIAALGMVMEFREDDVAPYLQARAPFTRNGDYLTVGGRHVLVDYDPVRRVEDAWNARIVHNPTNPYWGDVWFVNQRSKDDVPHMFRSVPMLQRAVLEAPDASVREAAALALDYLEGFARDMVDSGYQIRTKYEDGEPVLPRLENGSVKDLASLVAFDRILPNAECNGKLGASLIGYSVAGGNDCEDGDGGLYETTAANTHYFNYAIIRYFHIAAVYNALMLHETGAARDLLQGLADRADALLHDASLPHRDNPVWDSDVAAFLLASAAAGLPLTNEEARLVVRQYTLSAEHYSAFPYWDPWDASVPDGEFAYVPNRGTEAVRETEVTYLLEYCYSPLRNPATARLVDCNIVRDPARWGEGAE